MHDVELRTNVLGRLLYEGARKVKDSDKGMDDHGVEMLAYTLRYFPAAKDIQFMYMPPAPGAETRARGNWREVLTEGISFGRPMDERSPLLPEFQFEIRQWNPGGLEILDQAIEMLKPDSLATDRAQPTEFARAGSSGFIR